MKKSKLAERSLNSACPSNSVRQTFSLLFVSRETRSLSLSLPSTRSRQQPLPMKTRSVSSFSAASRRGGAASAAALRSIAAVRSLPSLSSAMPLPQRRSSVAGQASASSAQQAPPVALPIDYSQVRRELGSGG